MLQFCSRLFYNFAQAKKYIIVKKNYLIEAPPKKPASTYVTYSSQQSSGKKGNSTKLSSQITQSWKSLSNEAKSVYESKYKESKQIYEKAKKQYDQKFLIPFRRVTQGGLKIAHVHKNKLINVAKDAKIAERGKAVAQQLKTISKQELQKLKKEVEEINANRKTLAQQFKFPERKYFSQSAFSRDNTNIDPKQRARAYKLYVENWYKEVGRWLKKNNISLNISDFKRLYNRSLKQRSSKRSEERKLVEQSKQELGIKEKTKEVASAPRK